jgi:hypothetical protein
MAKVLLAALVLVACQGAIGPQGPPGPPGSVVYPEAGQIPDGGVAPQPVTCPPATDFCVGSRIATCTLSGADAVVGQDCAAQGSMTNPASCVTSGCPAGQTACCRQMMPVWTWNFTHPAVAGSTYVKSYDSVYLVNSGTCVGSTLGLEFAWLLRAQTTCPSDAISISVNLDRVKVAVGSPVMLTPSTNGASLSATVGGVNCSQWSGTVTLHSDLPNWSVSINANCTVAGTTLAVMGTMSGNE